jgi:hypothetical protein
LQQFGVNSAKLGCFVLDNAANNDTAIAVVAETYDFLPVYRRHSYLLSQGLQHHWFYEDYLSISA